MNKKVLIIGSNGQLGTDMGKMFRDAAYETDEFDFPRIDISKRTSVDEIVGDCKPGFIINCAAFTAVDDCETNREQAFLINAQGAQNVAAAATRFSARIIHISTDYVFDGTKDGFYEESDAPNPQTVYGSSKLEGERLVASACGNHQIFRIAWLYGLHGKNFVFTIRAAAAGKAAAGERMMVVADQIGTPTSTKEVCRQVLHTLEHPATGVFHATCEGECSWYDFARVILASAQIPVDLHPCSTAEFPRPAARPNNSRLENRRLKELGIACMADWETAFREFLEDEAKQREL